VHPVLFHIGSILIPAYGAVAALGVLLALTLVLRTARIARVNQNQLWNLCILSLFAALVGSRLLLVVANWTVLRLHPAWVLGLGMIHHPLVTAAGTIFALAVAAIYARRNRMPIAATADALAPPLALGLAFEQAGALTAGAGYGTETHVPWAVVYTHPLAAMWSGAPIGIPVHPVQGYAALAFLGVAASVLVLLPRRRQQGDAAGAFLMAAGAVIYLTEFFRDPEGRGMIPGGAIDGPQIAAIVVVIAGAVILRERRVHADAATIAPQNEVSMNENPHD
jgi:phosphatidylglycerol:prolipoprotein diacylglycerol transferase